MKRALYVLRAQPFHLGHLRVIKWILKRCDKVFIVIGSSQESNTSENPFTFKERREMIEKSLESEGIEEKKYVIIGIPDVYDDESWVKNILKRTKFDIVFTRNPWTKRCFDAFNIPVKEHPVFGDISASEIRKLIKEGKEWEKLVPGEVEKILKRIDLKERFMDEGT